MAKRRRLDIPQEPFSPSLETKSAFGLAPARTRPPIADIAGEAAGRAAEAEMAQALETAEAEGRVIQCLPLDRIETGHLIRDRLAMDVDDMAALQASIAERGQQTPIEVVETGAGWGLVSGLRRVAALRALGIPEALAIVRRPDGAEAAYRAMIEENEIRADLSFYERANIAVAAAGQGVYPTPARAVAGLFAHAPSARRSKIARFVVLCEHMGPALSFAHAIPEKLGLALAAAIEADPTFARRLKDSLRKAAPEDAGTERRVLERALKGGGTQSGRAAPAEEIAPGLKLAQGRDRVALTGAAVDADFIEALKAWAVSHAKIIGVND